jgi:aldose sugar dehydrogenase
MQVDTLARGLVVPWGITSLPDGRVLITERPGRIRVLDAEGLAPRPWATLDVHSEFQSWGPESGLLGIAAASDFATSREVFVLATVWRSEGDRAATLAARLWRRLAGTISPRASFILKNRVIRFTERDGHGVDPTVIVDDLPAHHYHAGGGIAFGPDGRLYVSVGDATRPELLASDDLLLGAILRYERDGTVPADNPVEGSPVFARGLRNTQAFAWLPDGTMLGAEHGPSGMTQEAGRAGNDEVNVLRAGADYGWPRATGWEEIDGAEPPLWVWREAIAPGGLAAERRGATAGPDSATILVAGLRRRLERLVLTRGPDGRWRAVSLDTLLGGAWGRLRTLAVAPDGSVLLATSNRDARGQAGPHDDLILRLRRTP